MKQFTAHTFESIETANFDPRDYSELKFGSDRAARLLGRQMAKKFWEEHKTLLTTQRCVVIPSAFKVVEIAATILARHFRNELNDKLTREGYTMLDWTLMQRTLSYTDDYSTLPEEKREALIMADEFYLNKDFIQDKVLLFVDDCLITGKHEAKIRQYMHQQGIENPTVFCYFTTYKGGMAKIENQLNFCGMQSIEDYLNLIQQPGHQLVVRATRYLLDIQLCELEVVLNRVSDGFVDKLYHACISQEYDKEDKFRKGFELIRFRHDNGFANMREVGGA
jgi:uracil phosphoribosyltransferase